MKQVSHNIVQWDPATLEAFILIALLQRARMDNNFRMDMVTRYKNIDHSRYSTADDLIGHLGAVIMRLDPIIRVEISDEGDGFKSQTLYFSELNEFLNANPKQSTCYYPAHYPTKESFFEIVDAEYPKLMGL